ncbi:MAG: ABC-2 type transport system ATP-binding protein [Pseudohongiellaceae bacterium]
MELSDLTKHYGDTVGLEGLNLSVARGEVVGLLGPNGAGKTTALRLLLGLIGPTRGTVRLFGRPPRDPAARIDVGYLPGELSLDELFTGQEMLVYMGRLRPRSVAPVCDRRRSELCERLALDHADLSRVIRDNSRGTKQKVGLVAAFQHDPALLVLDEPTSGLDPLVREAVFELMAEAAEAGRTVLHSSHILGEVDRTCSRVAILREGRLVGGGEIEDIRATLTRLLSARFHGSPPIDELRAAGAELVSHDDGLLKMHVGADINPILEVLARHPLKELVLPEPDLSLAFARYYASSGARADPL